MIFDRFPSKRKAADFAVDVYTRFGLGVQIHTSEESARYVVHPFPCRLKPPVVLVDRSDDEPLEKTVEGLVNDFGGTYAGT